MKLHEVKVYPSAAKLARAEQLTWKISEVAEARAPVDDAAREAVIDRMIDNAAVAVAALEHRPVITAREQARAHLRAQGATLFGGSMSERVDAEWAAWANCVAVRELDMHDTFLGAEYAHPADNIPPLLAVAQQCRRNGYDLLRAILTAYEIHIGLAKGICLHQYKKDHIAHLCPATAAGLGALLGLATETIYQAVQHAVHVSFTTRQSRKGEISSWKAFAPAHSAKLAIEAVDRAMRGETSPSPIYEGEDGVIAYMLGGAEAVYHVPLPEQGEPRRAILESFTKEHSAEYQAQALIDIAFRMRRHISDFEQIERVIIHTSHHTHNVIGCGSGDPQKFDPAASRETLDHSAMYIFAVALQDGFWHHVKSYAPERATRPDTVRLWRKIVTVEEPAWTGRYHKPDPSERAYGALVEVIFRDGTKLTDELAVANAHPAGERPFARADYLRKFTSLVEGALADEEARRFLSLVQRMPELSAVELLELNPQADLLRPKRGARVGGIF
jgi:2-methylcitrate dehydratase